MKRARPQLDAELDGRRERPRFRRGILRRGGVAGGAFVASGGGLDSLGHARSFDFITIADAYTTGSSLMPQKKNPDMAELTRGKAGRVYGNLMSLLTLLKGLPMTYNRDLQEDKERLFDSADTVRAAARLMAAMMQPTQLSIYAAAQPPRDPALLATDLADYLVRKGMPFRQAHHVVGVAVATGGKSRQTLEQTDGGGIAKRRPNVGPGRPGCI